MNTTTSQGGRYCTNCGQRLHQTTPVNTGHGQTGDSGCPNCLTASVVPVVEKPGDTRTVNGGYIPKQQRADAVALDVIEAAANVEVLA